MLKFLLEDDMEDLNNTEHYRLHIYQFVQNHHKEFQPVVKQLNLPLMFLHHKF